MKNQVKQHPLTEDYGGTERKDVTVVKQKNGWIILLVLTTILFLGTSIYLFSDHIKQVKTAETLTTKVTESEGRYTDLDTKYTAALAEIESYKGKNAEMDSMLAEKEKSIQGLQASLNKERKHGQISESDYKKHLDELNGVVAELNAKIETLQKENLVITAQRDSLGKDIGMKVNTITDLQTSNTSLTKKVTIASLIIPQDIVVAGSRFRSNGKELVTNKAQKAQQIKLCFKAPENKVADPGKKVFLIRLISPQFTVLSVTDEGSGQFNDANTNQVMLYTTSATIDYDNQPKDVCVHWNQKEPFTEGKYTAEIYQDGYLVGKQNFEMK